MYVYIRVFPGGISGKRIPVRTGDSRDVGSIPGSGRRRRARQPTPGFLPGNSTNRGAWRATVYRVSKSWTRLK